MLQGVGIGGKLYAAEEELLQCSITIRCSGHIWDIGQ